jgi:hypothetical protein
MGEVITFVSREQLNKRRDIDANKTPIVARDPISGLAVQLTNCCAPGCTAQSDGCFEYIELSTGKSLFKHYCGKHLHLGLRKEGN